MKKLLYILFFISSSCLAQNKKISQLPSATTPLAGAELVEIVQGGINKKVAASFLGTTGGGGTVTSVGLTSGTTGTDVNITGSPVTGSGTITLNIPSASSVNRGVVTTGAQTFNGTKTMNGNNSSSNAFFVDNGSGTGIKFYTLGVISKIETYGTNGLDILTPSTENISLITRNLTFSLNGQGSVPVTFSSSSMGSARTFITITPSYGNFISPGIGTGVKINTAYSQTSGSVAVTGVDLDIIPSINNTFAAAGSIHYGVLYHPVETNLTNTTHYGFVSASTTALSGFGTSTPTAIFHTVGATKLEGTVTLPVAGNGILIKEGTNATMGVSTLVAGTVTVSTTKVTANSRIFLTGQNLGTITVPVGYAVSARTAGTSFTILSANLVDTSTVGWIIIEPAP